MGNGPSANSRVTAGPLPKFAEGEVMVVIIGYWLSSAVALGIVLIGMASSLPLTPPPQRMVCRWVPIRAGKRTVGEGSS